MLTDCWDDWLATHELRFARVLGDVVEPHPALRASRLIDGLCDAIRRKDSYAIQLAIDLLRVDPRMPFGRTLKSQIARAFRKVTESLTWEQRKDLLAYRDKLLGLDHPPRETEEFSKLARSLGEQS